MNFSQALDRIKWGQPMRRAEWEDGVYVHRLNAPDNDKIDIHSAQGDDSPWSPSIADVLADDWLDTTRSE